MDETPEMASRVVTRRASSSSAVVVKGRRKKKAGAASATQRSLPTVDAVGMELESTANENEVIESLTSCRISDPQKSQPGKLKRKNNGEKKLDAEPYTLFRKSGCVAEWDLYLKNLNAVSWVAPVDFFKHAPMALQWKELAKVGTQIELPHPRGISRIYCVGTIIEFAGYKALVRLEDIPDEKTIHDTVVWISFCSSIPKHLGYSLSYNKLLLPNNAPELITRESDEEEIKALNGKFLKQVFNKADLKTISDRHAEMYQEILEEKHSLFSVANFVEVMDKEDPVRNRLAAIICIVGDRIIVRYLDAGPKDQGFVFNMNSELVHPLGWSHCIGQELKNYPQSNYNFSVLPKSSFPKCPSNLKLKIGMVFELRHPIHPYKIVAGSVCKKLKYGYFVADIKTNDPEDSEEFVFHVTSDYILPCGFCKKHNLPLAVPSGEDENDFSWDTYCQVKHLHRLELGKLPPKPAHKFVKGTKLEAVDLSQPLYFGPATLLNIADHLLYLHFDGWPCKDENYQWVSAFSPDIYPAGWAEMVGHSFQSHAELPIDTELYYIPKQSNK